jgi:uncharacterized protein YqgV (UPF0045/DUF77 family)
MIATVDISMYALSDDYSKRIVGFIQRVKQHKDIRVEVNGMSTQLFGEYDVLMDVLKKEMYTDFETGKSVFILKIVGAERTKEKLPDVLK